MKLKFNMVSILFITSTEIAVFASLLLFFGLAVLSEITLKKKDRQIKELLTEKEQLQSVIASQLTDISRANLKYNDLKSLQTYINHSIPYTVISYEGDIGFMSERLRKMLDIPENSESSNIVNLLSQSDGQQQYLQELLSIPRSQTWEREIKITTPDSRELWLNMTIIPQYQQGITPSILLICQDISEYIKARELNDINRKHELEQELNTHKTIALQVIQAQEVERDRIGKDIHDGIGQILTALKFNVESINLDKPEKVQKKLHLIKQLAADIIKRVREVTFNLRPPELADYGIGKGLAKLAEGVSDFTGVQVEYVSNTDFNERLEPEVETNLYRIAQEAVNNAVKYAQSTKIQIILYTSHDMLSIKIKDDGKGFEETRINGNNKGMGLNSMRERAKYINSRIFISSNPGAGSSVTVNVPLKQAAVEPMSIS